MPTEKGIGLLAIYVGAYKILHASLHTGYIHTYLNVLVVGLIIMRLPEIQ